MGLKILGLVVVMGAASATFAGDTPTAANEQLNFTGDSAMVLPASGERVRTENSSNDHSCYTMRTYRVRKDLDRESVLKVKPDEVAFDADNIVGYSTCQRAGKFAVKSTQ